MYIKRVGVVSLAKILGILYGGLGLIFGAIFALISLSGGALGAAAGEELGIAGLGVLFGIGAIVFLPIFYGVIGFIGGLISGSLFNLAANLAGGLQVEIGGYEKSP